MLTFFIVIASFEAADQPAVQYVSGRLDSREICERAVQNLLFKYKIDFDVEFDTKTEQRIFTSKHIAKYPGRDTRLNCVEVASLS